MEITWMGHACFRLRGKEATLVTDPYGKEIGLSIPRVRADIITISHAHPNHSNISGFRGEAKIVDGPGEYEINGVFIFGIQSYHDKVKGAERGPNTIYVLEFTDLTVCHLGDLGHTLTQSQVEAIGDVDVLLVPVGGGDTLSVTDAAEVVSQVEPRIVIPMHYAMPGITVPLDPPEKFLKEMGAEPEPPQEVLKLSRESLPEEMKVVLLQFKQ
ncbi:MAG: MBL fold metallo-hydrolase [Chloroflexi bacterium]|nr:MBL fold metallo-hydrolase [Chloroflexota bacterium]